MNCCKQEQVGTTEHGKMLKRIQVLEEGRVPAKEATKWKIDGQKTRITRKEYRRFWSEFKTVGLMAQKKAVERRQMLRDRGALLLEEGHLLREYKAMHEERFLSGWLRDDVESTEESKTDMDKKAREEESRCGKREERERRGNGGQRRCVNPFSRGNFEDSCPVEVLGDLGFPCGGSCGGSGGSSVCGSADRLGCLVCLRCLFLRGWWEIWVLTPFLFLIENLFFHSPFLSVRKRRAFFVERQGDTARRRAAVSRKRTQEVDCGVDHRWAAVDQSVARRMLCYLDHGEV